jgi:chromosome segregation ATPase
MQEQTIQCPKCAASIQLTESLLAPTLGQFKTVIGSDEQKLKDLQKRLDDVTAKVTKEEQRLKDVVAASSELQTKCAELQTKSTELQAKSAELQTKSAALYQKLQSPIY